MPMRSGILRWLRITRTHIFDDDGYRFLDIGLSDLKSGQRPQGVVPAAAWFFGGKELLSQMILLAAVL